MKQFFNSLCGAMLVIGSASFFDQPQNFPQTAAEEIPSTTQGVSNYDSPPNNPQVPVQPVDTETKTEEKAETKAETKAEPEFEEIIQMVPQRVWDCTNGFCRWVTRMVPQRMLVAKQPQGANSPYRNVSSSGGSNGTYGGAVGNGGTNSAGTYGSVADQGYGSAGQYGGYGSSSTGYGSAGAYGGYGAYDVGAGSAGNDSYGAYGVRKGPFRRWWSSRPAVAARRGH